MKNADITIVESTIYATVQIKLVFFLSLSKTKLVFYKKQTMAKMTLESYYQSYY